ncbi:MAG TPA: DNA polymerase III subunit gamma/tau [Methylomirabilota bacterium]|nr:DNA polymerase III subunit gamma/tau [Methylomirabilota bacterium]
MDDRASPPVSATAPAAGGYRVLARKYRPQSFADLIGHDAMVRTLANAFETGRIAQAWMLTGVRGVGKTTTARILARALNYEIPGKIDRPSVDLDELGVHCAAIMEGRHVDVIEMDAASHTGVGDVREIIDASRYKPATARYKVYIIDEVHMLSTQAFNALLKTLEEPPEHVKFLFATTEIRKVPITVLSRCQRFDLRRVDGALLAAHLAKVAGAEGVPVDDEAIGLIARAAEGSVRDSLTLLDQAIAHGGGAVAAETVRGMLGLADRARIVDLFELTMKADVAGALAAMSEMYDVGADPASALADLASIVHLVTRLKHVPAAADDPTLTDTEKTRGQAFAAALSIPVLTRAWQILLKGVAEVQAAPRPLPAAEMVIVRLAYASDLPTPDEAIRLMRDGGGSAGAGQRSVGGSGGGPTALIQGGAPARAASLPAPSPLAGPVLASFEDVVRLAEARRDVGLKFALERHVRLAQFEDGHISFTPVAGANAGLAGEIGRKLTQWTGRRWIASVSRDGTGETLHEKREAARNRLVDDARADPTVAAILARFPGAEIVDVRMAGAEADLATPAIAFEDDAPPPDPDDYGGLGNDLDDRFGDFDD